VFCGGAERHYLVEMIASQQADGPGGAKLYRIVIRARATPLAKGFGWEIFKGDRAAPPIQQSTETYRTMEIAYEHGALVMARLERKAGG
jgi:hypothetical protein